MGPVRLLSRSWGSCSSVPLSCRDGAWFLGLAGGCVHRCCFRGTLLPSGVCRCCFCMAGFRMFPRDRAQTHQIATASPPVGPGRGIGVFATFHKTCGILHVIILCLNPEHFVSVFSWNMLSSFQLKLQIFLQVMESFLYLENRFQLCLLRCLLIAMRLGVHCPHVCPPLCWWYTSAFSSAWWTSQVFLFLVQLLNSWWSLVAPRSSLSCFMCNHRWWSLLSIDLYMFLSTPPTVLSQHLCSFEMTPSCVHFTVSAKRL